MKFPQQRFGVRVRQLRIRKGWTQEQLAERAGRHWTYMGGIERGERNVTLTVDYRFLLAELAKFDTPSFLPYNPCHERPGDQSLR